MVNQLEDRRVSSQSRKMSVSRCKKVDDKEECTELSSAEERVKTEPVSLILLFCPTPGGERSVAGR